MSPITSPHNRIVALVMVLFIVAAACSADDDATDTTTDPTQTDTDSDTASTEADGDTATSAAAVSCDEIAAQFGTKGSVNPDLAEPVSDGVCDGDSIVVTSNGIPDYTYIETSPGAPRAADYTFVLPASPTVAETPGDIPRVGEIGVALNGVPIYGATEGTGGDVLSLQGALSVCGSHNGPTGFHIHLLGTSSETDCIFSPEEVAEAPQLLGYALDGYPIYTGNEQYTSSWELTDESLFASDTWSAHSFVEGSGDLDQCNGLTDDSGAYAYYTTDTFPYTLGCYRGEVADDAGGRGGEDGERPERPEPGEAPDDQPGDDEGAAPTDPDASDGASQ